MDMSSAWLSELELQDQAFMNQYHLIKPYDQMVDDFSVDSFSSESYTENPSFVGQAFETRGRIQELGNKKQLPGYRKVYSINKKFTLNDENGKLKPKPKPEPVSDTPNTFTISFGDLKPKDEVLPLSDSFDYTICTKKCPTMIRNPIQLQDHMLAERKRREKLAQRFISLSALLPDLKKMDKATVLEDAANYIQELQRRVKELEGLSAKKSKLNDDDGSSSDEANFGENRGPCDPEIKVRMSGSSVLVGIYCQKNYLTLVKALSEIQKLGLSISSSSAMPFANTSLLITIVAQKKDDFFMTSAELAKNLQLAL